MRSERLVLDLPNNDTIREYLKEYTSVAHLAGSDNAKLKLNGHGTNSLNLVSQIPPSKPTTPFSLIQ